MYICVVQCIAQSVSQPRQTCAADAPFLCGSWASCKKLSYRRETARQLRMSTIGWLELSSSCYTLNY